MCACVCACIYMRTYMRTYTYKWYSGAYPIPTRRQLMHYYSMIYHYGNSDRLF